MNELLLDTDERLDKVVGADFQLIQKIDGTAFAIDTLLLADFVILEGIKGKVADLGSGSGILAFLLKYRKPALEIVGVEVLEEFFQLAQRNQQLNPTMTGITFEHMNVTDIPSRLFPDSCELVVSNPPYYPKGIGKIPEQYSRAIARHELAGTLRDFIESAAYLLPYGSKLAMVLPAGRFYEALALLKESQFGVRRLRFVKPKEGQNASLALFEAERFYNGPHEPVPELIIRMADGGFSPEVDALINLGLRRKIRK